MARAQRRTSAYGQIYLSREHLDTLKKLSDRCGGWIVFDGKNDETFVPLDEWKRRYETGSLQRERPG